MIENMVSAAGIESSLAVSFHKTLSSVLLGSQQRLVRDVIPARWLTNGSQMSGMFAANVTSRLKFSHVAWLAFASMICGTLP